MARRKMTKKAYEELLNECVFEHGDAWFIAGKDRYTGRRNYGTLLRRHDPIAFRCGYWDYINS